jgi:Ca2+-binding EF-hand superfamily protein
VMMNEHASSCLDSARLHPRFTLLDRPPDRYHEVPMPFPAILLPILAAAAQTQPAQDRPIVVTGYAGVPFISPMGEPFRPRRVDEDALADWFRQADRNHDGFLTSDEMVADADRFFATLDTDHNGQIEPEELVAYEWEIAPEIQVNSKLRRPRAAAGSTPPPKSDEPRRDSGRRKRGLDEGFDPLGNGPQGAGRYSLLNMPEPVAAADEDFNRAITQAEFREAAVSRFQLLDKTRTGRLTVAQLEAMLPKLPPPGTKPKRRRADEPDARVGQPLPPGN